MGRYVTDSSGGAAVKSIQTGYTSSSVSNGTGEEAGYLDVTISSVNTSKSVCMLIGGNSSSTVEAWRQTGSAAGVYLVSAKLASETVLRLSTVGNQTIITARWTVVEYY